MKIAVKVYDTSMNILAFLDNAFNVGYEQRLNEVGNAHFSLPANDPKAVFCELFNFVEIYDNERLVDLYRIVYDTVDRNNDGIYRSFQCEHVLSTLMDDVLFGLTEISTSTYTVLGDAMNVVLTAQSTVRWQLVNVQFSSTYTYNFENENLLSALFKMPILLGAPYQWEWDTTTSPWSLDLNEPFPTPQFTLLYRKNIQSVMRELDSRSVVTKLYALGSGEGVNQLTIKSVNGDIPYITASTTAYGTISGFFVDKSESNAFALLGKAQTALIDLSAPRAAYRISGADLSALTGDSPFEAGAYVKVIDEDLDVDIIARIVSIKKDNITEELWNIDIEISNKVIDLSISNTDIRRKQSINDLYSQGATNIDTLFFQNSAGNTFPSFWQFFVSSNIVNFNTCTLSTDTMTLTGGATATAMNTYIDGNLVTSSQTVDWLNLDIIPYLNMTDGRVTRDVWHTVEFVPNMNALISAQVVKQISVSGQGGGNF
jgi:phage minor structural protein